MPENIPKNYSLIAVVIILVLIGSGYVIFTNILPDYDLAKLQFNKAEADNQTYNQALSSVQSFLEKYQEQQNNSTLANLVLPDGDSDLANFITGLSHVAQQSGVVLSNFQIDYSNETARVAYSIQNQNVSFSANGSYSSLKNFIVRLENHMRLVDVYHVTLNTIDSSINSSNLDYEIRLRTYYQQ